MPNGYTYAGNNPWSMVDPYGDNAIDLVRGIASGIGSGVEDTLVGLYESVRDLVTTPGQFFQDLKAGIDGLIGLMADAEFAELLGAMFPEVRKLLRCWDQYDDFARGQLIGKVVGAYGFDIVGMFFGGAGAGKFLAGMVEKLGDMKGLQRLRAKLINPPCPRSFLPSTVVWTAAGPVPIGEIKVGDRLLTPETLRNGSSETEVDPDTWRRVRYVVADERGEKLLEVEELLPEAALAALGLAEQGWTQALTLDGSEPRDAFVLEVSACPQLADGPGRVVMALVRHHAASTWVLETTSGGEVGVTSDQMILSADRGGWREAGEFVEGERVATQWGPLAIASLIAGPVGALTIDVDVELEDAFLVGDDGVVVHNCAWRVDGRAGDAAETGPRLLNPPINLTDGGLAHTLERHAAGGAAKFAGKSKFNSGEDIKGLIRSGTQQPMVRQANGNFARTFDVGREIGFDRSMGGPTSIMTIITRSNGDLVTAFPGR